MVKIVGVLGATSMVGKSLLPLLVDAGWRVQAYTRQTRLAESPVDGDAKIVFRTLPSASAITGKEKIAHWVCLAPIWVLPDHFPMLAAYQAKRVVALGSTSIYTKRDSADAAEQVTAEKLSSSERRFVAWAEANRIEWVILRPTLIYGLGRDRNICEIASFISRFGFFPLLGIGQGLRQPVHVEDVAYAVRRHCKVHKRLIAPTIFPARRDCLTGKWSEGSSARWTGRRDSSAYPSSLFVRQSRFCGSSRGSATGRWGWPIE